MHEQVLELVLHKALVLVHNRHRKMSFRIRNRFHRQH